MRQGPLFRQFNAKSPATAVRKRAIGPGLDRSGAVKDAIKIWREGIAPAPLVVRTIKTGAAHAEYTPIGHTVNLASRLQTLANAGSTVISDSTRKFVEGYFSLRPLGPAQVKGISEPINVHEVVGLGPLRTRLQRSKTLSLINEHVRFGSEADM